MRWQRKLRSSSAKYVSETDYKASDDTDDSWSPTEVSEFPPGWKQHTFRPPRGTKHWFDGIQGDSDGEETTKSNTLSELVSNRNSDVQSHGASLRDKMHTFHQVASISAVKQAPLPRPLRYRPGYPNSPSLSKTQGNACLQRYPSLQDYTTARKSSKTVHQRPQNRPPSHIESASQQSYQASTSSHTVAKSTCGPFSDDLSIASTRSSTAQTFVSLDLETTKTFPAIVNADDRLSIMKRYSLFPDVTTSYRASYGSGL